MDIAVTKSHGEILPPCPRWIYKYSLEEEFGKVIKLNLILLRCNHDKTNLSFTIFILICCQDCWLFLLLASFIRTTQTSATAAAAACPIESPPCSYCWLLPITSAADMAMLAYLWSVYNWHQKKLLQCNDQLGNL